MGSDDVSEARASNWALSALVWSVVVYRLAHTVADPDLWGHVVFGKQILATRRIAQTDLYSYIEPGRLWTNHEWLIDVILATLFERFGAPGLIVPKVAIGLLTCGLLFRHLRRCQLTQVRASLLLLAVVHAMIPWLITVRAQLATFLFFLLTLLVLYRATTESLRWLWTVPLVFLIWANLHGGFLAGLGALLVWSVAQLATDWGRGRASRQRTAGILAAVVAGVVATSVNPFGIHLLVFLYRTALGARPDISEWQPIVLTSLNGILYLTLAVPTVLGLVWSRRERSPALLAVLLAVMAMPFLAARHVPLALLVIAVVAAQHMNDAWQRIATTDSSRPLRPPGRPTTTVRLLRATALVLAAVLIALSAPRFSCIRLDPVLGGARPARAVAMLKQSGVPGNMAVDFDWGTYVLARLGPRIKVSIDGRRETLYEGDAHLQSLRFRYGIGEWDTLLTKYDTHLALVAKNTAAFNLMKQRPGWRLLYEDPLSALFGREGLPQTPLIASTPVPAAPYDGRGLCFP